MIRFFKSLNAAGYLKSCKSFVTGKRRSVTTIQRKALQIATLEKNTFYARDYEQFNESEMHGYSVQHGRIQWKIPRKDQQ